MTLRTEALAQAAPLRSAIRETQPFGVLWHGGGILMQSPRRCLREVALLALSRSADPIPATVPLNLRFAAPRRIHSAEASKFAATASQLPGRPPGWLEKQYG
jgi:hypothetical protein